MDNYLTSILQQFRYYKMLGEKAMAQVSDQHLFWQPTSESNSIAIIVAHLRGNMLSRWTDFLNSDGEKEWRNRDAEFEPLVSPKRQIIEQYWNEAWQCLFVALESLQADDLNKIVYIRNMGHTVVEAINRQLAHYAYHIGQIVLLAKIETNDQWQSLSIPKGGSKVYNQTKFDQQQHREHFTEEFLNTK